MELRYGLPLSEVSVTLTEGEVGEGLKKGGEL